MTVNNLVAEVTEILSEVTKTVEFQGKTYLKAEGAEISKTPTYSTPFSELQKQKEMKEQSNDEWYVKHRGIAYNFGAAGINVIGEEE